MCSTDVATSVIDTRRTILIRGSLREGGVKTQGAYRPPSSSEIPWSDYGCEGLFLVGECRTLLSLYALQPFEHHGSARERLERGVMRHTDLSASTLAESPCAETDRPK